MLAHNTPVWFSLFYEKTQAKKKQIMKLHKSDVLIHVDHCENSGSNILYTGLTVVCSNFNIVINIKITG